LHGWQGRSTDEEVAKCCHASSDEANVRLESRRARTVRLIGILVTIGPSDMAQDESRAMLDFDLSRAAQAPILNDENWPVRRHSEATLFAETAAADVAGGGIVSSIFAASGRDSRTTRLSSRPQRNAAASHDKAIGRGRDAMRRPALGPCAHGF